MFRKIINKSLKSMNVKNSYFLISYKLCNNLNYTDHKPVYKSNLRIECLSNSVHVYLKHSE